MWIIGPERINNGLLLPSLIQFYRKNGTLTSCNSKAGRIWLNLELAKKPARCLEYIVVHEMAHLLERRHNDRFMELMDQFMPQWRTYREELKQGPLGHEDWNY